MEIIVGKSLFSLERQTAVAIGKFDGIHLGHRRLLEEIIEQKNNGLAACVFTFDPPPAVLFGFSDGKELTTKYEKRILFEKMGIDIVIEFPLDFTTAAISPRDFAVDILAKQMKASFIAAGDDLSFGDKGKGDAKFLKEISGSLGFEVKTIDKVCIDDKEVSSTYIRSLVEKGDMVNVEKYLGMAYPVMGKVEHGNRIGRTMGFPTVNLLPDESKLMPPNGVYFSRVLYKGKLYDGISNVGYKPTVTSEKRMGLETYIYDFDQDIYDEDIEVYLYEFRRPERQFSGIDALKAQLDEDIEAGKKYWKK